ncbi:MAG: hypothetical protein WAL50_08075, partial [Kineosporiaceae bacterium]
GLDGVTGQEWDLAVDVSRQPGQVRRAARALADRCAHAVFVSTGNVYADHSVAGADESAPLLAPLAGDTMTSMEAYGPAKVACEQHLLAAFGPERCLLARPGLIGGPGDTSGRTGYWPLRFAHPSTPDGAVLVPDAPDLPCQVIDVRDLAVWLIDAGLGRVGGAFNAVGETVRLADHLQVARDVAGHSGPIIAAGEQWLIAHGVQEWMGERSLPLWLHDPEFAGFTSTSSARARAAGLRTRPRADTLADVLAWELAQGVDRPRGAGLSREDERALLAEVRPTGRPPGR